MMAVFWAIVIICFCSNSESTVIIKEPGENITLKCSSEGCLKSNDRYAGIYMYHTFTEKNEVYYYSTAQNSEIKERPRHKGRIWKNGTPMDHDITITNLTVNDSGVYTCVFAKSVDKKDECNVYTVFVRATCPRHGDPCHQSTCNNNLHHAGYFKEVLQKLVLIISPCIISMLLLMIFILLIYQKVKKRSSYKRPSTSPKESNDYVYEVMTKYNIHPVATSQKQCYNPYTCA